MNQNGALREVKSRLDPAQVHYSTKKTVIKIDFVLIYI